MLRVFFLLCAFTLSISANAATVTYTLTGDIASGTFEWDGGVVSNINITSLTPSRVAGRSLTSEAYVVTPGFRDALAQDFEGGEYTDIYWFDAPLDGTSIATGELASTIFGIFDECCNPTSFTATPSAVPLPAAAWLFGSALLGLAGVGKRRKPKQ